MSPALRPGSLIFKGFFREHPLKRQRNPISKLSLLLLLGISIFLNGCEKIQKSLFGTGISEGIVHYDVTFPYSETEGLMGTMLPKKMTLKFKDDRFVTDISAGMGMFRMRFISDNQEKVLHHAVEVMKKKKVVKLEEEEARNMVKDFPELTIIPSREKDSIAGLQCEKAFGLFSELEEEPMEIWHTKDIQLKDPNWCTQFHELKGVLMGYEVKRFGKRMRLRAEKVEEVEVNDSTFSTEEYEKVSQEEMNRTIEDLMENFE